MQAVVLAAGDGGRLLPHTAQMPKPLLMLGGQPLIAHVLDSLAEAGVRDAVVVVGHHGEQLRRALSAVRPRGMTVRFADNPKFMLGNARSIWAAREAVAGAPFVLAMGDHIIEPALFGALLAGAGDRCRLAIECAAPGDPRADEATRALVRDGRVTALGKELRDWNAFDTGAFWCTPRIFDVMTPALRDGEAGAVFATLARAGELDAVDVTGAAWFDIDTPDDLHAAESRVDELTAWRRDGRVA